MARPLRGRGGGGVKGLATKKITFLEALKTISPKKCDHGTLNYIVIKEKVRTCGVKFAIGTAFNICIKREQPQI